MSGQTPTVWRLTSPIALLSKQETIDVILRQSVCAGLRLSLWF